MDYYFQRYGDLELHRRMIADRRRTNAFARAIAEVIRPTDVVLDVGTGTGVLAMLCAKAGARRVFAIDQADICQAAANLVKANGLSRKVRVLQGPAAELVLDERVDVIVSEWLGNFAFVEGMLDDVVAARDINLAPGGRMLPSRVEVLLAPIDDAVLYCSEGPGFWRRHIHGLDFTSLEALDHKQGRVSQIRTDASALLADGQPLFSVDMVTASSESPFCDGEVEFVIERQGFLNGFTGWFIADLSEGVRLDTGPHQSETHWAQTYLPFPPRLVRAGTRVNVAFDLQRAEDEARHLQLTLSVGRTRVRYHLE